jgi:hypothetical protein
MMYFDWYGIGWGGGVYTESCEEDSVLEFEVLTAVRMTMLLFWVLTPCRLGAEDGDSTFFRNVGIYLPTSLHGVKTQKSNIVNSVLVPMLPV